MELIAHIILFIILLLVLTGLILYIIGFERLYYNDVTKKHAVNAPLTDEVRRTLLESIERVKSLEKTEVTITSYDSLKLVGDYYGNSEPKGIAILFHGYRSVPINDLCLYIEFFLERGWGVLLPDQRAHRRSAGQAITFGIRESRDVKSWAEYAGMRYGLPIVLAGVSMGAASVLMSAGIWNGGYARCIISDCGYTSPGEICKCVLRKYHVPVQPFYAIGLAASKILGGFDAESASAIETVSECKIPTLFIHGEEDDFIPINMSERLFENCGAETKKLVTVPGANHALSFAAAPEKISLAIDSFLTELGL